jgi:cbb3-type cytochrome oxidase subunit 3
MWAETCSKDNTTRAKIKVTQTQLRTKVFFIFSLIVAQHVFWRALHPMGDLPIYGSTEWSINISFHITVCTNQRLKYSHVDPMLHSRSVCDLGTVGDCSYDESNLQLLKEIFNRLISATDNPLKFCGGGSFRTTSILLVSICCVKFIYCSQHRTAAHQECLDWNLVCLKSFSWFSSISSTILRQYFKVDDCDFSENLLHDVIY